MCMEVSQSAPTIQVQSMLMSVMMLVIFALAFFIYKVKLSLARLKGIVDTEMIQVLDPMNQRLRDAERDQRNHIYNFDALQRQATGLRTSRRFGYSVQNYEEKNFTTS